MSTHFSKLRRQMRQAAIAAPILFFLAFLSYARGWWALAIVPAVLGALLLSVYPFEATAPRPRGGKRKLLVTLISLVGVVLFMNWIASLPGAASLFDQLFASEYLWDWRLIIAVAVWSCSWGLSNHRKVIELSDGEIISIYGDSEDQRSHMPNKTLNPISDPLRAERGGWRE